MTYVALSRVTSLAGLHIIEFDRRKLVCDPKAAREYNRLRSLHIPHLGPTDTLKRSKKWNVYQTWFPVCTSSLLLWCTDWC